MKTNTLISPQSNTFRFFYFLKEESKIPIRTVVFYSILSGLANAALLGTINQAANSVEDGVKNIDYYQLILFLIALVLFYVTKHYILLHSTNLVEKTTTRVRLRILDKLRHSDLNWLEQKGKAELYNRITVDIGSITNFAGGIINASQGAFMIVFAMLYIFYLSVPAFLITLTTTTLAMLIFLNGRKRIERELAEMNKMETKFFKVLNHVLDGFKEIKLHKGRNDGIYAHAEDISMDLESLKLRQGKRLAAGAMFSQVTWNLTLGAIVFIVPVFTETQFADEITKITAAILFIMNPMEQLGGALPAFNRANSAIIHIQQLEQEVDQQVGNEFGNRRYDRFSDFETIQLSGLQYSYSESGTGDTFSAGPFDFSIKKGELIYIIGGNGSGKSTFLKLLTGLYPATSGQILLDGQAIGSLNIYSYRELYSAIFTDFHLFDSLYGIPNLDENRVNDLLEKLQLGKKLNFRNGEFSTLNLSTGQRKRIGLISTILEDRPIYVFDEVAADQDPEFRRYFYEELVPEFQAQGKTVIMVTHDDKYFDRADRILKMDVGKIVSDTSKGGK
jgi:putative pyoverdin transport system ATP-binding/permease protein